MQEEVRVLDARGPGRVSPLAITKIISNMAGGVVSIRHHLYGPNTCTVTACAASGNAIGDATEIIRRGDADVMVAGGTEAGIVEFALAGFTSSKAVSSRNDDPEGACRPFDADRDGFVMAEGAATLILEEREHAIARGADIYAEVLGYGMSADGYHITLPRPGGAGAARAMQNSLNNARLDPADIDYINAHGTSTRANDATETEAIKTVFGDGAYQLPISSTKSMTGHLLGGAGAIEAIACILAIRDGVLPPTINYTTPDPDCDLDYVPKRGPRGSHRQGHVQLVRLRRPQRRADLRQALAHRFGRVAVHSGPVSAPCRRARDFPVLVEAAGDQRHDEPYADQRTCSGQQRGGGLRRFAGSGEAERVHDALSQDAPGDGARQDGYRDADAHTGDGDGDAEQRTEHPSDHRAEHSAQAGTGPHTPATVASVVKTRSAGFTTRPSPSGRVVLQPGGRRPGRGAVARRAATQPTRRGT